MSMPVFILTAWSCIEERREAMTVEDPVCRNALGLNYVAASEEHEGWAYFFAHPDANAPSITIRVVMPIRSFRGPAISEPAFSNPTAHKA